MTSPLAAPRAARIAAPCSMHSYYIYCDRKGRLLAVAAGWNWPAFLYGGFWAVRQQHWKIAGAYALGLMVFVLSANQSAPLAHMLHVWLCLMGAVAAVFLGSHGNDLIRERYRRAGYRLVRQVEARSASEAVLAGRRSVS
ncbi:hypothetical protein RAS12_16100 [Achromobacter seleniivolatilans]|uniref:Transmembrane protein n=1 Tax=Achromobacter seleniivolatilans TaxID=3047478 RepID=A0ABY9LUQ3_9BURK|nr:DUF2628 domain-containing protein [Achromobacter sp. R39]WMD18175.1 hypothetical protein RAS12_16100 [Achromobacter sp. R39]